MKTLRTLFFKNYKAFNNGSSLETAFLKPIYNQPLEFSLKKVILKKDENLFRLIFEAQIHIQIDIRYFKPFSIATYYVATIHINNLIFTKRPII